MRWEIRGADRESAADVTIEIEADTEEGAVKIAGRMMFVESVRAVGHKTQRPSQSCSPLAVSPVIPYFAPTATSVVEALPSAPSVGEEELYRAFSVCVTPTRLIVGTSTYVVANMTAVSMREVPPDITLPKWLFVCAPVVVIVGMIISRDRWGDLDRLAFSFWVLLSLGLVALGVWAWVRVKPLYALAVEGNSGRQFVYESPQPSEIKAILDALNVAIAKLAQMRADVRLATI